MNRLDTYAPADATSAEDAAYGTCESRIAAVNGRTLFESGTLSMDDTDGMFDVFGLPRVFTANHGHSWSALSPDEQSRWDALASVLRSFAFDRLDEDKTTGHADQIAA